MDSRDPIVIDTLIREISWRIGNINLKKDNAMSLNTFFQCAKEIRIEKENLIYALTRYKNLEQELDLPVKLEYRSALKVLTRKK